MIFFGSLGKTQKTIYTRQEVSIYLYLRNKLLHGENKLIKEFCLKSKYLFISTKNLLFVFLQFLGNITLRLGKGLLTNPTFRHFIFISVANLKIITKHVVISHFKRRNTCFFGFFLLNLQQIVFTMATNRTQFIKFCTIAISNYIAFVNKLWRIVLNLLFYSILQTLAKVKLLSYSL